ncbi:hypothetical protein E4T47_04116 [Aureobasidium subglaciale]|nr:hypothetical protein E4T47_04116 [Aureobasidium subglaciale]
MTKDYKSEGRIYGKPAGDDNHYTTGELGGKPIVLAVTSNVGTVHTHHLVVNMRHSFPSLLYVFVVGIAGGAPSRYEKSTDKWERADIHLGDVTVSTQMIGYDFGAELDDGFKRKTAVEDVLPRAPTLIASFLNGFKTGRSKAFMRVLNTTKADISAWGRGYERPSPETDRGGTWDVIGTIVAKGVVDYADGHKNKTWGAYPAARAALCAKALIEEIELEALDRLKIAGHNDSKANVFELFHAWLEDQRNGTWLLVLDNADEASYLLQPLTKGAAHRDSGSGNAGTKTIYEYVPISPHGSVLITTRYREMAAGLVDDADILTIESMGEQSALDLLQNKIGPQGDDEIAKQLVAVLEYIPLATSQAAVYIRQRGPRFSLERYLSGVERSELSQSSLLSVELREHRRDKEAANSIIMTWQISFEHLRQSRPSAADPLSMMSFFDPQGIPESILRHHHSSELNTEEADSHARSEYDDGNHTASIEEWVFRVTQ